MCIVLDGDRRDSLGLRDFLLLFSRCISVRGRGGVVGDLGGGGGGDEMLVLYHATTHHVTRTEQ